MRDGRISKRVSVSERSQPKRMSPRKKKVQKETVIQREEREDRDSRKHVDHYDCQCTTDSNTLLKVCHFH